MALTYEKIRLIAKTVPSWGSGYWGEGLSKVPTEIFYGGNF